MSRRYGSCIEKTAEIAALLVKAPRTAREIADLCDMSVEAAHLYFRALRDEGLVYVAEYLRRCKTGRPAYLYAWQPSVCAMPDAQMPRKK